MASLSSKRIWQIGLRLIGALAGPRASDADGDPAEDLWVWRERVFFAVFLAGIVVGAISYLPTLLEAVKFRRWDTALQYTAAYGVGVIITFGWRIPYKIRAILGLMLVYAIGVITLNIIGLHGSGRVWLFCFALLATAFLGLRYGLAALALCFVTMKAMLLLAPEKAAEWNALYAQVGHGAVWNIATNTMVALCAMAIASLALLMKGLELSLERAKDLQGRLAEQGRRLERANLDLRASEERHRLLLEASPDPIVMLDLDGAINYANPAFEAVFGRPAGAGVGAMLPFAAQLERLDPGGNLLARNANGDELEIQVRRAPLPAPGGGRLGSVLVLHDVSENRRAERERVAREKMQAAVETAGAACHELNQPLQAVLMQAELLLDDLPAEAPTRPGAQMILAEARRMARITLELNRLAEYHTKQYLGKRNILDLRRSTAASAQDDMDTGRPTG